MDVIILSNFLLWLNRYVRRIGKIIHGTLVIAIFFLYGLEIGKIINIPIILEEILFIALTINILLFLIYATSLRIKFNRQVDIYLQKGIPLESTEGFQYSRQAVDQSVSRSKTLIILILFADIFHFMPRYSVIPVPEWLNFITYFGISLVLIGLSLFLRIDYPDHTLLEPGNFISYHHPKSYPTFLDNVLADSLKSFMDPRTRFQLDNWLDDIQTKLSSEHEPDELEEIRVERAIERIILIFYLQKKVPKLVTDEVVREDLQRIIQDTYLQDFTDGKVSGLSLDVIKQLIDKMVLQVPEIFRLVDRLLVEIMMNPNLFQKNDKIIETVIPNENELDVNQPFRVLVYVLNMATHSHDRVIEVIADSSRHIEPPKSSVKFTLDDPEDKILELINDHDTHKGDLVYSERIVEILSNMLQVGDVTWLQFIPQEYGSHVLNLMVKEEGFQSYGTSVPIEVSFSLRNNLRKFMSSLSGLSGMVYPIIKAIFLNPLF